jgi:hypothetical protein
MARSDPLDPATRFGGADNCKVKWLEIVMLAKLGFEGSAALVAIRFTNVSWAESEELCNSRSRRRYRSRRGRIARRLSSESWDPDGPGSESQPERIVLRRARHL